MKLFVNLSESRSAVERPQINSRTPSAGILVQDDHFFFEILDQEIPFSRGRNSRFSKRATTGLYLPEMLAVRGPYFGN